MANDSWACRVIYVNNVYCCSDRTTLEIEDTQDEIKKYFQSRYIGSSEAVWNLFQFKTHEEDPNIVSLRVHLPGQQAVYFPSEASVSEITEILQRSKSNLMAIFVFNARNEDGRQYLYQESPQHFAFDERRKRWHPRQRGFAIGRMYHCSPIAGERYYLRLLLTSARDLKSFEDIRTVDGILYPTFRVTYMALHLIQDDCEWDLCFAETRLFATDRE
ncbi:hypothetical protein RMATCC62417_04472 [Rhizopus microsporus]|nr:hypothetical protein RMATCC62417_04472 [Rhizopus microsporus]